MSEWVSYLGVMLTVYRVIGWNEHFENNKSRERDSCGFVCVPNKQDGMGLTRILSEPDGAAIYGIWNLIIGACSRQARPRNGWLTDDGMVPAKCPDEGDFLQGRPWTVDDMALRWRRPRDEVQRALDFTCSSNVGWIQELDTSVVMVPGKCPSGALEGKGMEEKGMELRLSTDAGGVTADAAPPPPPVMVFPCLKGKRSGSKEWPLDTSFVEELTETFPDLDILNECKIARGWAVNNGLKTYDGMKKYLFDWMKRESNNPRGRRQSGPRGKNGTHKPTATDCGQFPESQAPLPEHRSGGSRAPAQVGKR